MNDIRQGDGVITLDGQQGIVTSEPFEMNSHFVDIRVRVDFGAWEGPIQLEAIAEVWRGGSRIDNVTQLSLWGES